MWPRKSKHKFDEEIHGVCLVGFPERYKPTIFFSVLIMMTTWQEWMLALGLSIPALALIGWVFLLRREMKEEERRKKIA